MTRLRCGIIVGGLLLAATVGSERAHGQYAGKKILHQYKSNEIAVPRARADEPVLPQFSLRLALDYVEQASTAWSQSKKCVACHANGAYRICRRSDVF